MIPQASELPQTSPVQLLCRADSIPVEKCAQPPPQDNPASICINEKLLCKTALPCTPDRFPSWPSDIWLPAEVVMSIQKTPSCFFGLLLWFLHLLSHTDLSSPPPQRSLLEALSQLPCVLPPDPGSGEVIREGTSVGERDLLPVSQQGQQTPQKPRMRREGKSWQTL